jgi:signal transduction histidine kinase
MRRLRSKMLLTYVAVIASALVPFAVTAYLAAHAALEEELGRRLTTLAQAQAAHLDATRDAGRIARLEPDSDAVRQRLVEDLRHFVTATGVRRARIATPRLESLVDSEPVAPFATYFDLESERHEIDRVFESGETASSVLFVGSDGLRYKRGFAPLVHEGRTVAVVVVEGSATYFALMERYRNLLAGYAVVAFGLTVLVTLLVSRRITAPLGNLVEVAKRIGSGSLGAAVPRLGDDEIGELGDAIEQMRAGLAARDEQTRMLLAGIAHEVRNPLGGIELFVGLLEDELRQEPDRLAHVQRVRRELDYLKRVVNEFLAYARDSVLQESRFAASTLLGEVVESVAAAASARGAQVRLSVQPDDLELSGDREAVRGAVQNLVMNAVEACGGGGLVEITVSASGPLRRVAVRDSGCGMSEETLARAAQPFFTTREKGTGLGLALARKVAERHGGDLELSSQLGVGTTVTLQWPFRLDAPTRGNSAGAGRPGDDDTEMIG